MKRPALVWLTPLQLAVVAGCGRVELGWTQLEVDGTGIVWEIAVGRERQPAAVVGSSLFRFDGHRFVAVAPQPPAVTVDARVGYSL